MAGERFMDNKDGTITDHLSGLMWANTDNQDDIDWIQAEKWVKFTFSYTLEKCMTTGVYHQWRNSKASM
jgi:hypothetical protein